MYGANLVTNVEGLAHLSLLFLIMCGETTTSDVHHAFLYIYILHFTFCRGREHKAPNERYVRGHKNKQSYFTLV